MDKLKKYVKENHNKISALIVSLYFLVPIIIMGVNFFSETKEHLDLWFKLTVVFGVSSALVGIINLILNIKRVDSKKIIIFIIIVILLALSLISVLLSFEKHLSLIGENYRHISYFTYLLFLGFYLNAINIDKIDYKILGIILSIVSTTICSIALLNNDLTYKFFYKNNFPYNGIFMHPNHLAYYLSITTIITMFLTLYENNTFKKILYYLMLSIEFITLIANDTFGSYIGVAISILLLSVYSVIKKKNFQLIFIVALFISLSAILSTDNGVLVKNNFTKLFFDVDVIKNSNNERMIENVGTKRGMLWKYAFKVIKHKPLFGVGPNNLTRYYKAFNIREAVPHNFLLEIAAFNGIPALIVYLCLLLYIFIKNIFKLDNYNTVLVATMISYLISALFGNMFFYTSPYFVISVGMLSGDIIFKKDKKKKISI